MDIMLFAGLKEKLGSGKVALDVEEQVSVKELKQQVYETYPALDGEVFQVASNEAFVRDEHIVSNSDIIALIPPVSGG